ncbi:MAG: Holliday junction resolvase-like protein [Candidatus Bathyarchaeota archaeon]|nr:Holliday junction resolvase-like protein [Candidatus Bathyarchaeota archaeon]
MLQQLPPKLTVWHACSKSRVDGKKTRDEIGQRVFEKAFREGALAKSRAVLKGALAEQLAPIFKIFGYNPSDARFIGDPVDYVIFDSYTNIKERIEDTPSSSSVNIANSRLQIPILPRLHMGCMCLAHHTFGMV